MALEILASLDALSKRWMIVTNRIAVFTSVSTAVALYDATVMCQFKLLFPYHFDCYSLKYTVITVYNQYKNANL